jgi:hypothetical protein
MWSPSTSRHGHWPVLVKRLGVVLGQGYLLGRPERAAFLDDEPTTATSARRRVQRVRAT